LKFFTGPYSVFSGYHCLSTYLCTELTYKHGLQTDKK